MRRDLDRRLRETNIGVIESSSSRRGHQNFIAPLPPKKLPSLSEPQVLIGPLACQQRANP